MENPSDEFALFTFWSKIISASSSPATPTWQHHQLIQQDVVGQGKYPQLSTVFLSSIPHIGKLSSGFSDNE
jgi:hypothetical protein